MTRVYNPKNKVLFASDNSTLLNNRRGSWGGTGLADGFGGPAGGFSGRDGGFLSNVQYSSSGLPMLPPAKPPSGPPKPPSGPPKQSASTTPLRPRTPLRLSSNVQSIYTP